jgi:hypothetical protein
MLTLCLFAALILYIWGGLITFWRVEYYHLPSFDQQLQLNGDDYSIFRYLYDLLLIFLRCVIAWPIVLWDRRKRP